MGYEQLGNVGLLVSRLCLGTMSFSDGSDVYQHIGSVGQEGADALMKGQRRCRDQLLRHRLHLLA